MFIVVGGSLDKLRTTGDAVSVLSDDTPRTEDFEQAFQSNLVKQVAGVTVSNFSGPADTDTDTINSDYIKQKLNSRGEHYAVYKYG